VDVGSHPLVTDGLQLHARLRVPISKSRNNLAHRRLAQDNGSLQTSDGLAREYLAEHFFCVFAIEIGPVYKTA
jgi:hypothetical protein